jgi:glutathione S-transferase
MRQRARARSLCAEMHSGFGALRSHCPMNIEAALPEVGARVWARAARGARDVARIETAWADALAQRRALPVRRLRRRRRLVRAGVHALRTYALPVSPHPRPT